MTLTTRAPTADEVRLAAAGELRYKLADRTIDEGDIQDLRDWLGSSQQLTQGNLVREFEQGWNAWLGRRYTLFCNSGSSANLLMYYAAMLSGRLDATPPDGTTPVQLNRRVIVPAVAWATTIAPAIQLGLDPILCDADPRTFGLDLRSLEALCEEYRPGIVTIVQTLGVPNDMDAILGLQDRYGFLLLEDACPATGSTYKGRRIGTFGDMSSFSLYFGHHLSTIEGGLVFTDDERLHDLLLLLRSHGWAKDLDAEKEAALAQTHALLDFNRIFTFYVPGFNFRATELQARIGLSQLRKIDWVVRRRTENQVAYEERFSQPRALAAGFTFPRNAEGETCSISFVALAASGEHRQRVVAALGAARVETRPLSGGSMGRQPFITQRYGRRTFAVADAIHTRSFMLPNNPYISVEDVHRICDVVLDVDSGDGGA